jgi:transposase
MNTNETLRYLTELKRHMHGQRLLLIWDGLPAHRAKQVTAWIKENDTWLRMVRFPAYAPELNPIEYLWSVLKRKHVGNLCELTDIGTVLKTAKRKLRDKTLLQGFLRASSLY